MSYRLNRKKITINDFSSYESDIDSDSSSSSLNYDLSSLIDQFKLTSLGPVNSRCPVKSRDPTRGVFHSKPYEFPSFLLSPPQTDESNSSSNDSNTLDKYINLPNKPVLQGKEANHICYLEASLLTIDKIRDNNLLHKLIENDSYEIEISELTAQVVYETKLRKKVTVDSEQFFKHVIAKLRRIESYEKKNVMSNIISQKNKYNETVFHAAAKLDKANLFNNLYTSETISFLKEPEMYSVLHYCCVFGSYKFYNALMENLSANDEYLFTLIDYNYNDALGVALINHLKIDEATERNGFKICIDNSNIIKDLLTRFNYQNIDYFLCLIEQSQFLSTDEKKEYIMLLKSQETFF